MLAGLQEETNEIKFLFNKLKKEGLTFNQGQVGTYNG